MGVEVPKISSYVQVISFDRQDTGDVPQDKVDRVLKLASYVTWRLHPKASTEEGIDKLWNAMKISSSLVEWTAQNICTKASVLILMATHDSTIRLSG